MLALPEAGMATSVNVHRVNVNFLCDWLEASAVFDSNEFSKSDVTDILLENHVYHEQDFAMQMVDEAWSVLKSRISYLKSPLGIVVDTNRISRLNDWRDFSAYSFCLALACAELYPEWAKNWKTTASVHGGIFEELAAESIEKSFDGWTVRRVGWAPDNPVKLHSIIHDLIEEVNEVPGAELGLHVDEWANELGLDLLAYRTYNDEHASFPVLMIQCASGKNWIDKRHTPDLSLWSKIINFNSQPLRGFAMPFAFADTREFRKQATKVNGLFLDRNRLVGVFSADPVAAISSGLRQRMVDWTNLHVTSLPKGTV